MSQPIAEHARILIVDGEPANVRLLEKLLGRAGYSSLASTADPRRVPQLTEAFDPDLILLDLRMPHRSGFEVLQDLPVHLDGGYLPVLVMTGDLTRETRERALSSGAKDFLTEPMDAGEVLLRIHNLLETRFLHRTLADHNRSLKAAVQHRTRELEEARLEVLERLASVIEFRDDDTGQHTHRVGRIAERLAAELGLDAEQIALAHHERWDGTGYPRGLSGESIPLAARIVALVDFYDALSHDRPYRTAWTLDRIRDEIRSESGLHDPGVVEAFTHLEGRGLLLDLEDDALEGGGTDAATSGTNDG